MTRKQNGMGLAAAVFAGCLGFLLLVVALINTADGEDVNPARSFPLVMLGLVVLATAAALGWRAASKKKESSGSR